MIEEYFYSDNELIKAGHTNIMAAGIGSEDLDVAHFDGIVQACFRRFVCNLAQPTEIKDLELVTEDRGEAILASSSPQVENLFLTKYYVVPAIQKLQMEDRTIGLTLYENVDDITDVLDRTLYDNNGIAVLLGDVGEGKSTFLSWLSLQLRCIQPKSNEKSYIPVIIDVQQFLDKYNSGAEKGGIQDIIDEFWIDVVRQIQIHFNNPYDKVSNKLLALKKKVLDGATFEATLQGAPPYIYFSISNDPAKKNGEKPEVNGDNAFLIIRQISENLTGR